MHIQAIQSNTNFKSNPKVLSSALTQGMISLKNKMNAETIILKTKDFNKIIRVRGLEIQDKAVFKDGQFLAKKDKNNKMIPYGKDTSMLEFDGVRIIAKDDGTVIEHKKPLFKSWSKILEQAHEYIKSALDNYNNENLIKKITQKKETLTHQGGQEAKAILDIFEKLSNLSKKMQ